MSVAVKITEGEPENEVFTNVYLEDHENVMVALDVLRDATSTYIVMPYLRAAETLNDFIMRKQTSTFRKLRQDTAKLYMKQILSAVAHLHAGGISHGDLHWGNIMLQRNLQKVTIIDFGCSDFGLCHQRNDLTYCGLILRSMKNAGCMGLKVRRLIGLLIGGNVTAAEALSHAFFKPGFLTRLFRRMHHT